MNQSPLLAESEAELAELYDRISDKYFVFDSQGKFLGCKSLEFTLDTVEPLSSFTIQVNPTCGDIFTFIRKYRDHYQWFTGTSVERITTEDRTQSSFKYVWLLLDSLIEDAARQYKRLFSFNSLFGMYEIFEVCNNTTALEVVHSNTLDNYSLSFLLNMSDLPLLDCFLNQPPVTFNPDTLYLFPSSFTHKLTFKEPKESFVLCGGFA